MSLLRRYTSLRARKRYVPPRPVDPIPPHVRAYVRARDNGCIGPRIGMPEPCFGGIELDHVLNGGMGKRGPSTASNLISVCHTHHRIRTDNGRTWRPIALDYLSRVEGNRLPESIW